MKETISVGMWLLVGFVIATLFIGTVVGILALTQTELIDFLKQTEDY